MRHANKKKGPYTEKKKQSLETAPEETQILDLLDKNFKLTTLNRFKS